MGETAIAPLGGASPSVQESSSEKEEPPAVADCTSLTLVDGTQGESASLLVENQDLGVEREVLGEDTFSAALAVQNQKCSTLVENEDLGVELEVLGQDTFSAAPAAQNQKSSTYAEMKLHSEQEYSASLPADNLIYCAEPSNLHELTHSAPQVEVVTTSTKNSNPTAPPACEKWSMEAIAQRSQLRLARTARLNTAKALGESPGFEYLQECWEEDPA